MAPNGHRGSLFSSMDANKDGLIDRTELMSAMQRGLITDTRNIPEEIWARARARDELAARICKEAGLESSPARKQPEYSYSAEAPLGRGMDFMDEIKQQLADNDFMNAQPAFSDMDASDMDFALQVARAKMESQQARSRALKESMPELGHFVTDAQKMRSHVAAVLQEAGEVLRNSSSSPSRATSPSRTIASPMRTTGLPRALSPMPGSGNYAPTFLGGAPQRGASPMRSSQHTPMQSPLGVPASLGPVLEQTASMQSLGLVSSEPSVLGPGQSGRSDAAPAIVGSGALVPVPVMAAPSRGAGGADAPMALTNGTQSFSASALPPECPALMYAPDASGAMQLYAADPTSGAVQPVVVTAAGPNGTVQRVDAQPEALMYAPDACGAMQLYAAAPSGAVQPVAVTAVAPPQAVVYAPDTSGAMQVYAGGANSQPAGQPLAAGTQSFSTGQPMAALGAPPMAQVASSQAELDAFVQKHTVAEAAPVLNANGQMVAFQQTQPVSAAVVPPLGPLSGSLPTDQALALCNEAPANRQSMKPQASSNRKSLPVPQAGPLQFGPQGAPAPWAEQGMVVYNESRPEASTWRGGGDPRQTQAQWELARASDDNAAAYASAALKAQAAQMFVRSIQEACHRRLKGAIGTWWRDCANQAALEGSSEAAARVHTALSTLAALPAYRQAPPQGQAAYQQARPGPAPGGPQALAWQAPPGQDVYQQAPPGQGQGGPQFLEYGDTTRQSVYQQACPGPQALEWNAPPSQAAYQQAPPGQTQGGPQALEWNAPPGPAAYQQAPLGQGQGGPQALEWNAPPGQAAYQQAPVGRGQGGPQALEWNAPPGQAVYQQAPPGQEQGGPKFLEYAAPKGQAAFQQAPPGQAFPGPALVPGAAFRSGARVSLFSAIDANGDGIIDYKELQSAMQVGIIMDGRPPAPKEPTELWRDVGISEAAGSISANVTEGPYRGKPSMNETSFAMSQSTRASQSGNGAPPSDSYGFSPWAGISEGTAVTPQNVPASNQWAAVPYAPVGAMPYTGPASAMDMAPGFFAAPATATMPSAAPAWTSPANAGAPTMYGPNNGHSSGGINMQGAQASRAAAPPAAHQAAFMALGDIAGMAPQGAGPQVPAEQAPRGIRFAQNLEEVRRQTVQSAASSVFFCFGDNPTNEETTEEDSSPPQSGRRQSDFSNMGGAERSRTDTADSSLPTRSISRRTLPANYQDHLSNHFEVQDVARRPTLAAKALNVSKTAGRRTVAGAFRQGAKLHHPDKGGQKEDFQVLREAYARLLSER